MSPGVEGQGMSQDLKFSSLKKMLLSEINKIIIIKKRKSNKMCSSWAWPEVLLVSSQPGLRPSLVVNASTVNPSAARLAAAVSRALATVSLLPVLASPSEWVRVFFILFFCLWPLQPAACKHQVWPNHYKCCYALQHPGAISLIVYAVWFGPRVASDQSEVMTRRCQTNADLLWCCACILGLLWMNSH